MASDFVTSEYNFSNYIIQEHKVALLRKIYRLIPLDIRKKIKRKIQSSDSGIYKVLRENVKFDE